MMSGNEADGVEAVFRGHMALALLRLLTGDVLRGSGNDQLLHSLALAIGFRIPHAELRVALALLERSGALVVTARDPLLVVEITRCGGEVAAGLVDLEGVERPGPECPY